MIGALTAVPLVLAVGGAVDLSMLYAAKLKIQAAADAAALAAAKQYPLDPTPAHLEKHARNVFGGNVGSLFRTEATLVYEGTTWTENHSRELRLHVDYSYAPMFLPAQIASISQAARVESAVMVSDTTVEVAMVLDTSGSMLDAPKAGGESKIATLRKTARAAADKFFAASDTGNTDPTRVAVVPFSGAVNVGTDKLDVWWMDPKGRSPIHQENFDWASYTDARGNQLSQWSAADQTWRLASDTSVYLTRQYVYKNMKTPTVTKDTSACIYKKTTYPGCSWSGNDTTWQMKANGVSICTQSNDPTGCHPYKITYSGSPLHNFKGCVEARSGVFGINDAVPDETKPETLFVPYFAADEPDVAGDSSYFKDYYTLNNKDQGFEFPAGIFPLKGKNWITQQRNMNKYLLRPTKHIDIGVNNIHSPSFICDSAPILPLSTNATTVDDTIKNLQAVGATNVDEGVGWGWRTLSPTEPFAGSRAFSDEKNIKAMIVMTDGENTSYVSGNNNKSWFSSYGHAQVYSSATNAQGLPSSSINTSAGRIFEQSGQSAIHSATNYTLAMDGRTKKVCANAKNDGATKMRDINGVILNDERGQVQKDGIVIYTIAFDIPAASKTRVDALLSDCASWKVDDLRNTGKPYAQKKKNFYSASNAADLDAAFTDIVASLSRMRVSR